MTTLVLGASGATGRMLIDQLLGKEHYVKIIVRCPDKLPDAWLQNRHVAIVQANVTDLSIDEMAKLIGDCDAVISCLGHNLNLKGIYGKPRKLVTDAIVLICQAIKRNTPENPVKVILMNTAGNPNRDLDEPLSLGEHLTTALLRLLVPPHPDNEQAAEYLRVNVGQNDTYIEWVVVRPDTLIDEKDVSDYQAYISPIRSAIFNAGKTSRINVGNFMAQLVSDTILWKEWKGQMPVLYNSTS